MEQGVSPFISTFVMFQPDSLFLLFKTVSALDCAKDVERLAEIAKNNGMKVERVMSISHVSAEPKKLDFYCKIAYFSAVERRVSTHELYFAEHEFRSETTVFSHDTTQRFPPKRRSPDVSELSTTSSAASSGGQAPAFQQPLADTIAVKVAFKPSSEILEYLIKQELTAH